MKRPDFNSVIHQTPVYFAVFQLKKWTTAVDSQLNVGDILVYQPEAECFAHITTMGTRLVRCPVDRVRFYGYLTPEEAKAISREQNG